MSALAIRRVFGISLLLFSGYVLFWGLRPVAMQSQVTLLLAKDLFGSNGSDGLETGIPADVSVGTLRLEIPSKIRLDDAATIHLVFEPSVEPGSVFLSDRMLQARLEMAGIQHTPTGEVSQVMLLEHPVTFLWNLRPQETGLFDGTVWLYVRPLTHETGQASRRVLIAQQVETQVTDLINMSGSLARLIGSAGVAVGAVLGLDGLVLGLILGRLKS